MRTLKHVLAMAILIVLASGSVFAQSGHPISSSAGDTSRGPKWHPRDEWHFGLSDSCWKVFLSGLPADSAQTLVKAFDGSRDAEQMIDSLRKAYSAARKAKDTALMRAILEKIKDERDQIRDDRLITDRIIDEYHSLLIQVRKECDNDGRKSTIGLRVTPIVPNPATTKAHFSYTINADENVLIQIFDQSGNMVKTVFDGPADQGEHDVNLDLSGLKSGIYLVRIQAGPDVNTIKLVIAGSN
jgi:hypothetical protein